VCDRRLHVTQQSGRAARRPPRHHLGRGERNGLSGDAPAGQVDAISTDNAILEGLAAQDPNTKIVGPTFTQEPYGMAISKAHPDFTSFVNGVLTNERADGTWAAIYNRWLGAATRAAHTSPARRLLPGSVMTETSLADLDRRIEALGATLERTRANLVELDLDVTARRWPRPRRSPGQPLSNGRSSRATSSSSGRPTGPR